jgi:photosystem II stability/assembly factor-like uncharacterized protein
MSSLAHRTLLACCCWFAVGHSPCHAQWQAQVTQTQSNLRGLCAVDRNVAWASGTKGTFLRTIDGGTTWHVGQVPGGEELNFRDVEALDGQTAWVLSIGHGPESRIYKTTDAGQHWTEQFRNESPEAFFDALAFWDAQHGIAFSDPVEGHFRFVTTTTGGTTWEPVNASIPAALSNESAFAASGTCLVVQGQSNAWFATGGAARSRVFRSTDRGRTWSVSETPVRAGTESAGIFSLTFRDEHHGVIIGGDYNKPQQTGANLAFTQDGGRTWRESVGFFPRGFRSAVSWVRTPRGWLLVAVGPSGSDVAAPDAAWRKLDDENYNALSIARFDSNAIWAAGPRGRIARLLHLPQ